MGSKAFLPRRVKSGPRSVRFPALALLVAVMADLGERFIEIIGKKRRAEQVGRGAFVVRTRRPHHAASRRERARFSDLPSSGSGFGNRRGLGLQALRRLHRNRHGVSGGIRCVTDLRGFADRNDRAGENGSEQNDLDVRCAIKEIK